MVYSQFLRDVGATDEDMDNSLLKTVLEVIQQVLVYFISCVSFKLIFQKVKNSETRLRISSSDSALVVPAKKTKKKHADDSGITNKNRNPLRNPRSQSSKHFFTNSREQLKLVYLSFFVMCLFCLFEFRWGCGSLGWIFSNLIHL